MKIREPSAFAGGFFIGLTVAAAERMEFVGMISLFHLGLHSGLRVSLPGNLKLDQKEALDNGRTQSSWLL